VIKQIVKKSRVHWYWLLASAGTFIIVIGCSHFAVRTVYTDANGTSVSNEMSLHYEIPTNSALLPTNGVL
jgi:hypothetical protein